MCGILGVVKTKNSIVDEVGLRNVLVHLYKVSESRGHDSSGIAIVKDDLIQVNKKAIPASNLVRTKTFNDFMKDSQDIHCVIAHARMETNGSFSKSVNNQPVVKDGIATIHNGIIVNDGELWNKNKKLQKKYEVDTEVFNSLVRNQERQTSDLIKSIKDSIKLLEGAYSFAALFDDYNYLLLATNTGSLHYIEGDGFLIFASEFAFLDSLLKKFQRAFGSLTVKKLDPGKFFLIEIDNLKQIFSSDKNYKLIKKKRVIDLVNVADEEKTERIRGPQLSLSDTKKIETIINQEYNKRIIKIRGMKRCKKCLLPETMPFIEFDDHGVCNFCNDYQPIGLKGKSRLEKELNKYRRNDGKPDCIMAFSGGRDSSYALHYVKKELGMNPVAYSYDWGMLTDLGRRNQARMTGMLGVEHILVSADIQRKRENIRLNVNAWLKRPNLGTVPLFMAGDKQYFYHAQKLSKQMGLDLVILSENLLEMTSFKSGFCGIKPHKVKGKKFYALNIASLFKMMMFYGKEYLLNPSYINRSLLDSVGAFGSYYVMPHNLLSLYSYIEWNENKIEDVLLNQYDWEIAKDTKTTWRIGDGTASFYNYIYYMVAGFSEIDTFRSNQIREGVLTRQEAMEKIEEENKPRVESLIWYTDTIGVDIFNATDRINSVKPLYNLD